MAPEVSDFIPGWLEETDKHIEVADRHHVTVKQKRQVRIKMCDKNEDPFLQRYTTYFWHHIYAIGYFQLLI